MYKKRQITICILLLLVLAGCSDKTAPTAVVTDYTQNRNIILSEDALIGKMVTNISDNKEITLNHPVDITNFSDIDFTKIGSYQLNFVVSDDAGNKSNYTATLTLEPTAGERDTIAFETTVEEYTQKVKEFSEMKLGNQDDIEKLEKQIKLLNKNNYTEFQEKLDDFEQTLHAAYLSANDVLLNNNLDLLEEGLAVDSEDNQLLAYQEELEDIDVSDPSLTNQSKIYSRGLKIEDGLGSRIKELQIEKLGIDEELFDNEELKVSTCSYNVSRKPNVKVNIGYGSRQYFAYTNEYGQLAYISADEIIVQDESTESVNDSGQYCDGPAQISGDSGTTAKTVISDSLGAASNSYNVIPAGNVYSGLESIENEILANGGATEFKAYFTYETTDSTTPHMISISYKIGSQLVEYNFNN